MNEVGGLFDGMIKRWIEDALKNASFDYKKFLAHAETKKALQSLAIAAKDSASLPFDLDDKGIDYVLAALVELLNQYKDEGPVKVGATPELMERRSRKEVEDELRKVGIDPITIGSLIMLILQYALDLIAMIKKIFGK